MTGSDITDDDDDEQVTLPSDTLQTNAYMIMDTNSAPFTSPTSTEESSQDTNVPQERLSTRKRVARCMNIDLHRLWSQFDKAYMQPLFGGRHAPRMNDLSGEEHDLEHVDVNHHISPEVQNAMIEADKVQEKAELADVMEQLEEQEMELRQRDVTGDTHVAHPTDIGNPFFSTA